MTYAIWFRVAASGFRALEGATLAQHRDMLYGLGAQPSGRATFAQQRDMRWVAALGCSPKGLR